MYNQSLFSISIKACAVAETIRCHGTFKDSKIFQPVFSSPIILLNRILRVLFIMQPATNEPQDENQDHIDVTDPAPLAVSSFLLTVCPFLLNITQTFKPFSVLNEPFTPSLQKQLYLFHALVQFQNNAELQKPIHIVSMLGLQLLGLLADFCTALETHETSTAVIK